MRSGHVRDDGVHRPCRGLGTHRNERVGHHVHEAKDDLRAHGLVCVLELAGCFVDAGDLFAWIAFVEWKTHEPATHTVAQFSLFVLAPHTHRSLNPEVEFVGSHATMREVFAKCSRHNGEHDIVHRAVE